MKPPTYNNAHLWLGWDDPAPPSRWKRLRRWVAGWAAFGAA